MSELLFSTLANRCGTYVFGGSSFVCMFRLLKIDNRRQKGVVTGKENSEQVVVLIEHLGVSNEIEEDDSLEAFLTTDLISSIKQGDKFLPKAIIVVVKDYDMRKEDLIKKLLDCNFVIKVNDKNEINLVRNLE